MKKAIDPRPSVSSELLKSGYLFTEAHRLFHKTFHVIKLGDFMDFELSVVFRKPILDIYKFDDWLHCQFGEYEEKGMSMHDVIVANYGGTVATQIKELLG